MRRSISLIGLIAVATNAGIGLAAARPVAAASIINPEPIDIVAGPGGSMWVTNYADDSISRITASGAMTTYRDPAIEGPTDLVVGGAGVAVWFVGDEQIGRVGLEAKVVVHPLPGLDPTDVARGADGRIWVTAGGSQPAIARVNGAGQAQVFTTGITSLPTAITAGPDGRLWFVMPAAQQIAAIDTSGVVTVMARGVSAAAITTGPDGNLWFTNNSRQAPVGRLTPQGQLTLFPTADLPNNPIAITVGPDGNLWFTLWSGALGRITPGGSYTIVGVPSPDSGIGTDGGLAGIATGPDGNMWFTNLEAGVVGRFEPTTGVVTYFGPPPPAITSFPIAGVADIVGGPDGNLWYASAGGIGRLTPDGTSTAFALPNGARGTDITTGADGNLWYASATDAVGTNPAIGRITTAGVVTELVSGGSLGRIRDLTTGPDGNVWFVNSDHTIGRVTPTGAIALADACSGTATAQGIAAGADDQIWWVCTDDGSDDGLPDSTLGSISPGGEIRRHAAALGSGDLESGPDGRLWSVSSAFENVAMHAFPPDNPGAAEPFYSFDRRFDYPRRLAAGPDGNVWFIVTDAIGTVTPDGEIGLLTIPGIRTVSTSGDGQVWFATSTSIGRLSVSA